MQIEFSMSCRSSAIPDRFTAIANIDEKELFIVLEHDASVIEAYDNEGHGEVVLTNDQEAQIESLALEWIRDYESEIKDESEMLRNPYAYHGVRRSQF